MYELRQPSERADKEKTGKINIRKGRDTEKRKEKSYTFVNYCSEKNRTQMKKS
jgi:hypothetical protein